MFKFTKKEQTKLELEIESLLEEMKEVRRKPKRVPFYNEETKKYQFDTEDEYTAMVDNLETLYKAKQAHESNGMDTKTALTIAANLLGIVLILKHEDINVITSKALGFVIKGRA